MFTLFPDSWKSYIELLSPSIGVVYATPSDVTTPWLLTVTGLKPKIPFESVSRNPASEVSKQESASLSRS